MSVIGYLVAMLIGGWLVLVIAYCRDLIDDRVNYGKKVYVNRRQCGRLVTIRYNGRKHYMYVNEFGDLSSKNYELKTSAIVACRAEFLESRPKQTTFARIA